MPFSRQGPDQQNDQYESCRPLVAVIIPVFNDREGLHKCLGALTRQVYPADRLEIVVVDNGSSPALAPPEHYPLSVQVVRCETPGSYAARNTGVRAAAASILAFTDADCVPDPEWLAEGVSALLAGKDRNIIGGQVLLIEPSVRSGTALYQHAIGFQQDSNIQHKGFTATANMFCSARQLAAVGPFNEQLLSCGDREWCWRAARGGFTVCFQPRTIVRTMPRIRLRDAVRQARRVSAGRAHLRNENLSRPDALARYRTLAQSTVWIASISHLSKWERIRVLVAAAIIRLFAEMENVRLRLGSSAERC